MRQWLRSTLTVVTALGMVWGLCPVAALAEEVAETPQADSAELTYALVEDELAEEVGETPLADSAEVADEPAEDAPALEDEAPATVEETEGTSEEAEAVDSAAEAEAPATDSEGIDGQGTESEPEAEEESEPAAEVEDEYGETALEDEVNSSEDAAEEERKEGRQLKAQATTSDVEPNDDASTASSILVNKTYSGNIYHDGDEDWYRFELGSAGRLEVTFNAAYRSDRKAWDIRLYDSTKAEMWYAQFWTDEGIWIGGTAAAKSLRVTGLPKGTYYVKVNSYHDGIPGYYNSHHDYWTTDEYRIMAKGPRTSLAKAKVGKIKNQAYTTKAIKPKPTVKYKGTKLTKNVDYTIRYKNNTKVGTATLVIKGKGSYKGTVTKTFKIVKGDIAKATFSKVGKQRYRSAAITPKVSVRAAGSGAKLKKGRDYTVTYKKNIQAGKATIVIKGIGNFAGTKKIKFKIVKGSIAKAKVDKVAARKYTGKAIKPKVVVRAEKSGQVLTEGTSYTLSYRNNKARGTATILITGTGKYQGTKEVTFKIA